QGKIVGNLNDHKLISKSTFVVLDKGVSEGYTQGKIIPIYMNTNNRNENSIVTENQLKIGKMIIVDSTDNYSVGYVLKIYQQVYVKDFVGSNAQTTIETAKSSLIDEESGPSMLAPADEFGESDSSAPDAATDDSGMTEEDSFSESF
ncbi:MAG: hypothetical protein KDD45_02360, partial [Bdellovibrionales bacterium]|nr:hypothetical protein [Bdellovibrionales bacterium]